MSRPSVKEMMIRIGASLIALFVLAGGAVFVGLTLAEMKMHRTVEVPVHRIALSGQVSTAGRGKYLYDSRGCAECHGQNGGGRTFIDDGKGMLVRGPNLTSGQGSAVAAYSAPDWVRAIRHGVTRTGRPLMFMPSEDYNRLTDEDLLSLVEYVKALPPVQSGGGIVQLPLAVRLMYGFGVMKDAAAVIDHSRPPEKPVPEAVSMAHGAYVANMCLSCHGRQLAGGRVPGAPPDWPVAPNLTNIDGGVMGNYPDPETLLAMFRLGKRPDGSPVRAMPFSALSKVSETDVRALHLYLKSIKTAS